MYLFALEISAIIKKKLEYINDTARVFNFITPILILTNVLHDGHTEAYFWYIQTWAALAIWFRFLLYLRTVSLFRWLIRMIVECIIDMGAFMIVYIIGVIAFADAFLSIEHILTLEGLIKPSVPFDDTASDY